MPAMLSARGLNFEIGDLNRGRGYDERLIAIAARMQDLQRDLAAFGVHGLA
jgi:hypothetical protein